MVPLNQLQGMLLIQRIEAPDTENPESWQRGLGLFFAEGEWVLRHVDISCLPSCILRATSYFTSTSRLARS